MNTCKYCDVILSEDNWSSGKQHKGWYCCNTCHTSKYRRYRKSHPFKARLSYFNKRNSSSLIVDDLQNMWDLQDGKCAICNDELSMVGTFCIDHIIPSCENGETTINNLQILCEYCNIGKYKWPMDSYIAHCIKIANH